MEKLLNLELARSHNFHLKLARYLFLHLGTLYSHKDSNFPLVMLTGLIKCDYRLPKTNRSQMRIFSIDNVLKTIFVLRWWLHDPSKHLLVFKTSSRRLEDMSWRRLQHVFSVTIFCFPRRLQDVLESKKLLRWRHLQNMSWRHVMKTSSTRLRRNNFTSSKTSSRRLGKQKIVTLKTSSKHVLKTCLEDVLRTYLEDVFRTSWRQRKCLLVISVSYKSKCVSNKSMFHKPLSDRSKANSKCVT